MCDAVIVSHMNGTVLAQPFLPKTDPRRGKERKRMSTETRFLGLHAGRDGIEAWNRPTGEVWRMDAGDDGMPQVAETLSRLHPQLVVMQANGNFELPMAGILVTFGLPVALVQPRNVRDFARAIGRPSRTEQCHAGILAQFAELVQPDASPMPEDQVEELRQLRGRRLEKIGRA